MTNSSATSGAGFRRGKHNWKVFDALPLEAKQFIWDAPIPVTTTETIDARHAPRVVEKWRASMAARMPGATEHAYGPDHPGSRTTLARIAHARAERDAKFARLARLRAELGLA